MSEESTTQKGEALEPVSGSTAKKPNWRQAKKAKAAKESNSDRSEDLKKRIAELEAKVAAGEEAALERVCKAMGTTSKEIKETEVTEKEPEPIIECWVPTPVRVNMTIYQGKVQVPKSTFHVIQQALGDRRMRLLRELTGNNYILEELIGGQGFAPRLVGKVDITGEKIA